MSRLLLAILTASLLLTGLAAQAVEPATETDENGVVWGRRIDGYRLGIYIDPADQEANRPILVTLILRTPRPTAIPTFSRTDRGLRSIGSARINARFLYPDVLPTEDPTVFHLPLALITGSKSGPAQIFGMGTFNFGDEQMTLVSGVTIANLSVPPAGQTREPISEDLALSVMRDRINTIPIPRVMYRDEPLLRIVEHLNTYHETYDPYSDGINLVWALPADQDMSTPINFEGNNQTLEAVATEVAVQAGLHMDVDTNAIVIAADPEAFDTVEVITNPGVHAATKARLRAIRINSYTVSRRSMDSLIRMLGPMSRQNDPDRKGLTFTAEFGDNPPEAKHSMDLKSLNFYEAVRYSALTFGVRYTLTEDGVVFLPAE